MSDTYTWNNPHSLERAAIETFLRVATDLMNAHPELMTFDVKAAPAVLSWLRGLVDRKPSELRQ